MSKKPGSEPLTFRDWILGLLTFVGFWIALAIALMGAWVATSLTVYSDGPTWLAVVGAIACFFVLPLIWELVADRKQVGGRFTDAVLRSGVLSAIFLIVIVATHAESTFKALATRGDWFLSSPRGAERDGVRAILWDTANGFEWLYNAVRTSAFDLPKGDPNLLPDDVFVAPVGAVQPTVSEQRVDLPPQGDVVTPKRESKKAETKEEYPTVTRTVERPIPGSSLSWPLVPTPHPASQTVPEEATTIAAIGKYLAGAEPDPLLRAKAVHDYVATHIAYSAKELADGSYKGISQEAGPVLRRGNGVCAGYSKLTVALGRAADLKVVYVPGDTRNIDDMKANSDVKSFARTSGGHAWNAVEINNQWYLMDTTWDSGFVDGVTFTPRYTSTYLFIPPEVMIFDHIPDQQRFQLLQQPVSLATWWRAPVLEPEAFAFGLQVPDSWAPITQGGKRLRVTVQNPLNAYLSMSFVAPDGSRTNFCAKTTNASVAELECELGLPGQYDAQLVVGRSRYGQYSYVARSLYEVKL